MNKSILIFGAGINQLELIREANKLGIKSVVIDPSENPPGKAEADFYYQVDGKDYKTTKEIAIKHSVDGIVTGQMEKPMRLMAELAKEMGYIFHTPEIVEKSLNKARMKKAFIENDVRCARGLSFNSNDTISEKALEGLQFPMIIKPVDAFSSRGVYKVSNFEEIEKYKSESFSFSTNSSIVIEEFLVGREFSVESITYNGKTTVIQVTEKFITPYPNTVEMAHMQPARITNEEKELIVQEVTKAVDAIGIDNSASHAEVMLTQNGVYMIEIGARLGGDFISSYLTKSSTGISMDRAAVQVALGLEPDLKQKVSKCSMIEYIELEEGKRIVSLPSIDWLKEEKGFVFGYYFLKEGDIIPEITHSAQRPLCIMFNAESYEEVFNSINYAKKIVFENLILE